MFSSLVALILRVLGHAPAPGANTLALPLPTEQGRASPSGNTPRKSKRGPTAARATDCTRSAGFHPSAEDRTKGSGSSLTTSGTGRRPNSLSHCFSASSLISSRLELPYALIIGAILLHVTMLRRLWGALFAIFAVFGRPSSGTLWQALPVM